MDYDLGDLIDAGLVSAKQILSKVDMTDERSAKEHIRRRKWFMLNLLVITPGIVFAIFGIGSLGLHWWTFPTWLFLICLNIWTWVQTSWKL